MTEQERPRTARLRIDGQDFDGADDAIRYLVGSHTKQELVELVVAQTQVTVDAEAEGRQQAVRDLEALSADLVNDHRGIPYDVIERIDRVAAGLNAREATYPQTACDRCTQGVMDQGNDHLHGRCRCECHERGVAGLDPQEPER